MKKSIIRLTESELHSIIKNSVRKCLNEWGRIESDLDADEIYGDRADREQKQAMRDKLFQDDWEMRNRRLRKKYPGKSREWYEAMIDTFYENKKPRKPINEIGDTSDGQRKLGALQARKVINADGETVDDFFDNQARKGGEVYDYAKSKRSASGPDSDEFGNTVNPLYKEYSKGYTDYLNAHPEELASRKERLRKLGY